MQPCYVITRQHARNLLIWASLCFSTAAHLALELLRELASVLHPLLTSAADIHRPPISIPTQLYPQSPCARTGGIHHRHLRSSGLLAIWPRRLSPSQHVQIPSSQAASCTIAARLGRISNPALRSDECLANAPLLPPGHCALVQSRPILRFASRSLWQSADFELRIAEWALGRSHIETRALCEPLRT
jgi:hypothetical protein